MHLPARFSCGPQLCWSAGKRCFAPPLPPQGFGDALPRLDDGSSRPHPSPSSAPLLSSAFATLESGKPVSCLAFAKRSPLLDLQGAPGLWIGTSWQPQPGPQVCVCACVGVHACSSVRGNCVSSVPIAHVAALLTMALLFLLYCVAL